MLVHVETIKNLLPEEYKNFPVRNHYLPPLKELASKIDLSRYTKWFVKKKLKVVSDFNLGIFLYRGMVREYKTYERRVKRVDRIKKTSTGEGKFSAKKTIEEFGK